MTWPPGTGWAPRWPDATWSLTPATARRGSRRGSWWTVTGHRARWSRPVPGTVGRAPRSGALTAPRPDRRHRRGPQSGQTHWRAGTGLTGRPRTDVTGLAAGCRAEFARRPGSAKVLERTSVSAGDAWPALHLGRVRGRGSVGRASPCQGEGRGFESRRPLGGAGRRVRGRRSTRLPGPVSLPATGPEAAEWPSGLGKGLQSPVRGFDSRLRLEGG